MGPKNQSSFTVGGGVGVAAKRVELPRALRVIVPQPVQI